MSGVASPLRINPRPQLAPWERLFDRIVVVSLPGSEERRAYIREHLPAMGIRAFDFFDATAADDPKVARAYAEGQVATYPNCFRCGGLDCGNDDCNNVLIPPQVATFITYLRLWAEIAQGRHERVLVMEDDVRLHPHTPRVLEWLAGQVTAGAVPFRGGRAALLRLGWALSPEHDGTACHASDAVRMSNPCHAITRDYAWALLQRFERIVHTADEYQHRLAPQPGEAFTVFPPIASELSWSAGVFASTIHPKAVRTRHLRAIGDADAARRHEQVLVRHVKKKHFRPLLIAGHPRCGTGYAASLCGQLGLDVGHEKLGRDGISSWMFAVDADENPYALDAVSRTRRAFAWKHLVMPVRSLADAAASVMRESEHAPPSYAFRRQHIAALTGLDLDTLPTPFERAVRSIVAWMRIVHAQQPALWFRIEDQADRLRDFLVEQGLVDAAHRATVLDTAKVNADKAYRGVRHEKPAVDTAAWRALSPETQAEVAWYCATFGYDDPCAG